MLTDAADPIEALAWSAEVSIEAFAAVVREGKATGRGDAEACEALP